MNRPTSTGLAVVCLAVTSSACNEQCFASGWVDCVGGTVIALHLGSIEELPEEPAPWRFEVEVEDESLVVECDWIHDCFGASFLEDADRGPWATLSDNSSADDQWLHIRAGYHYDSIEGSVVALLPRDVTVRVTDPNGVVRTQTWIYDPDHEGADVACTRCEIAEEVVELTEMAARPNQTN